MGQIGIKGCMDLKLDGCSHHSQRIFLLVLLGSSWGHTNIKGHMDLKLCGCSHHSERIILLVLLWSSEVILESYEVKLV